MPARAARAVSYAAAASTPRRDDNDTAFDQGWTGELQAHVRKGGPSYASEGHCNGSGRSMAAQLAYRSMPGAVASGRLEVTGAENKSSGDSGSPETSASTSSMLAAAAGDTENRDENAEDVDLLLWDAQVGLVYSCLGKSKFNMAHFYATWYLLRINIADGAHIAQIPDGSLPLGKSRQCR